MKTSTTLMSYWSKLGDEARRESARAAQLAASVICGVGKVAVTSLNTCGTPSLDDDVLPRRPDALVQVDDVHAVDLVVHRELREDLLLVLRDGRVVRAEVYSLCWMPTFSLRTCCQGNVVTTPGLSCPAIVPEKL